MPQNIRIGGNRFVTPARDVHANHGPGPQRPEGARAGGPATMPPASECAGAAALPRAGMGAGGMAGRSAAGGGGAPRAGNSGSAQAGSSSNPGTQGGTGGSAQGGTGGKAQGGTGGAAQVGGTGGSVQGGTGGAAQVGGAGGSAQAGNAAEQGGAGAAADGGSSGQSGSPGGAGNGAAGSSSADVCANALCNAAYPCVPLSNGYTCRGQFADWPPAYDSSTFIVDTDTVRDKRTGLEWQRRKPSTYAPSCTPHFDSVGPNGDVCDYVQAPLYCSSLTLAGGGWRLPTRAELESIIDDTRYNPAIDPVVFPETVSSAYCTSSPSAVWLFWDVYFSTGLAFTSEGTCHVRCVR